LAESGFADGDNSDLGCGEEGVQHDEHK
jgi:hypothetical protein